jgi:hypothetical protein
MNDQQRAAMQAVFDKANAVEIDSDECLDFDECTAMLVPLDSYNELIEAITALREALRNASERMAQPQGEPVAWITEWDGKYSSGKLVDWVAHARGESAKHIPLYTTPPSVEAMRIETLEKAATQCEQLTWYEDSEWFAAAIRSMK